ncbi:hypothetical protein SSBR45R_30500 [Bradyrhizobium sp. SSBR45R]|nr:hypothetical protein SSBR45R_30500 [Bradyrhizobium sp. SSBR45R]
MTAISDVSGMLTNRVRSSEINLAGLDPGECEADHNQDYWPAAATRLTVSTPALCQSRPASMIACASLPGSEKHSSWLPGT